MALNLPTSADEVVQRSKTDLQRELGSSFNPFILGNWISAIPTASANRIFDFYLQLQTAIDLNMPDTTSGVFLDRWASIYLPGGRNAATQSIGNVAATGTATTIIPISTQYQSSNGLTYTSTAAATITAQVLSPVANGVTSIGSTASVQTTVDHALGSNVVVTVAGADQTEYNGTFAIQVTGLNTFTYQITGTPASPATGTITISFTSASVPLQSDTFGANTNQTLDAPLTLTSPITGVDNTANADFTEIGGGVDQESDADLIVRLLGRIQNPVAHFNVTDIESKAKETSGVTRVFVQEITPQIGQVTIYFMRDNDVDPIPSASEVDTVKTSILTIKPANTADIDVIVAAPTASATDFTFSNITPDSSTMRTAVTASLDQFFSESTDVGVNIDEDAYRTAIFSTVDTETGNSITSFELTTPTGDIAITLGEIGTLGTVTYL